MIKDSLFEIIAVEVLKFAFEYLKLEIDDQLKMKMTMNHKKKIKLE